MTWTRLSDDFWDRPEMLKVSRSARLLHAEAMVWCNRMLTNGQIPQPALRRITDAENISELVGELTSSGLWSAIQGGQWQLDWSDQEDAADVKARAAYRAATQKRYRDRKARHERGDHSLCDPRYCSKAVTDNATGNKSYNETPSRPVPSRPKDRGQGQGAGAPPADAGRSAPQGTWGKYRPGANARSIEAMLPERCPHGTTRGLHYGVSGLLNCPKCALVAPPFDLDWFRRWIAGQRAAGLGDDAADSLGLDAPNDAADLAIDVACAVYPQLGGEYYEEGGDLPFVDESLFTYLKAYGLMAIGYAGVTAQRSA